MILRCEEFNQYVEGYPKAVAAIAKLGGWRSVSGLREAVIRGDFTERQFNRLIRDQLDLEPGGRRHRVSWWSWIQNHVIWESMKGVP